MNSIRKNIISLWNDIVKSSKLWEILDLLEVSEWDSMKTKIIKKNLQQLLYTKQFQKFQEKIWISPNLCDWVLWQKTLDHLVSYIVWIDDYAEWIWKETAKYLFNTLSWSPKWEPDFIKKAKEEYKKQKELKNQTTNNDFLKTTNDSQTFWWLNLFEIISYPTIKSEKTQSYCCSKTARINWEKFWLKLPRWDAYVAWKFPSSSTISTLPKNKINETPLSGWHWLTADNFNQIENGANFADIFASSGTDYGHRAVAFRTSLGKRFVLDPYIKINWKLSNLPIPLEKYILKWRKIVKAHFYHSDWYKKSV